MKMKKNIFAVLLVSLSLASCLDDGFLDIDPKDSQTESTAFQTYNNFKTYAWGLYDVFTGYGNNGNSSVSNNFFAGDWNADNMINNAGGGGIYAYRTAKAETTDSEWDYRYIRSVNLMLDNIDRSSMSEPDREHWRSVGYFFRSYKYFRMLSLFGGIPWVDHVLTDDSHELYGPRDSRDAVAANILSDLLYAEQHIREGGDGENTVNVHVVRALLSRFGLFEGTWRKYHGLPDAEKYLEACVEASEALMADFPTLHPRYEELFNSEDLAGVAGIILYKKYEASASLGHAMTRAVRTGENTIEVTKDAVDSYLCSNGLPVANAASGYGGDHDLYAQFTDRDPRLYYTVCPPYRVVNASGNVSWTHTGNADDRKFIDLMAEIAGPTGHRLPHSNFNTLYCPGQPNYQWNQTTNWGRTRMGFWVWKYYNTHTNVSSNGGTCTTDAPLFRMGEVLLNYAEAKCELGEFTQEVADRTVNQLRRRAGSQSSSAGVADMTVAGIDASFDPMRDPDVDALLWEIRRERRVELMGEGFRLDDLRRWKKGSYVDRQPLGAWIPESERGGKASSHVTAEGYVFYFGVPQGWQEKHYLRPLPLDELALNKALEQNPGWSE